LSVRQDVLEVFGGLTSAMVMLPLALAYGVASGLGPLAGLYGAIALGLLAAIVGGTRTMISGPTAPMVVATTTIIANHADNLAEVFTITMLAGLIQLLLGSARVGRFIAYAPYSVVSGFMTGIGVIVIVLQTRPLFGLEVEGAGVLATIRSWPADVSNVEWQAFGLAAVALVVIVLWPGPLRAFVPSLFAALVIGTAVSVLWLGDTPTIGAVPTGMPDLQTPQFSLGSLLRAAQPAATIALIGSIDTLLTARIAESMSRQLHNPHRDLLGQGIGHIATGLFGGLAGGATVCTVANIRVGARTRASGVICALALLAMVAGLGEHVRWVPHAVLAAVLMRVGFDFIDWHYLRRLHRIQREHLLIMGITLVLTVLLDLVTAVTLGFVTAALAGMRQYERLEMDRILSTPVLDHVILDNGEAGFAARTCLVALRGSFTVASSQRLVRTIGADIADHEVVIVDITRADYFDDSAALMIEYLLETAEEQGAEMIVVAHDGKPLDTLNSLGALDRVHPRRLVDTNDKALDLARFILKS